MKTLFAIFSLCFLIAFLFVPPPLSATRIISVTLCEQVDNTGTVPINIRQQFTADAPAIHALVELSPALTRHANQRFLGFGGCHRCSPIMKIDAAEVLVNQSDAIVHFL